MSIASRITAIEEHIRDIYDTIDYSYDTTGVDKNIINIPQNIFNGYLDVLNNGTDTLWNNLEKVSASGEEATLENVENAPIKMVLNGNTSQDTTTGKNLLNVPSTFSVTTSANITASLNAGTYTISLEDYETDVEVGSSFLFQFLKDNTLVTDAYLTMSYKKTTKAIPSEVDKIRIYASSSYNNSNGKTTTFKNLMIELGSTATSYEKYTGGIPSPNPDYPQEVKVVKGNNVVSVQGKNSFDLTKHTNTLDANTIIISSNEYTLNVATTWRGRVIVPIINFKKNTDYTFSYISNNPRSIISRISGVKDGVSTTLIQNYYYVYTNKATINTSDYDEIIIDLYATGNGSTLTETTMSNLQFEEGTSITSFVPYSKTDYPINLGDIELCKINTYKDFPFKAINGNEYYDTLTDEQKNALVYGKWYVHKEIGKYELDENTLFTQNWNSNTDNKTYCMLCTLGTNFGSNAIAISNILPYVSNVYGYDKIGIYQEKNNGGRIIFRVPKTIANSVSEFKTWLASNSMIVYTLIAPTEEEITNTTLIEQLEAIYKAKSVKDKTYITQTNYELPFILDVEAIKEYEVN